jgi:hypothetical protein
MNRRRPSRLSGAKSRSVRIGADYSDERAERSAASAQGLSGRECKIQNAKCKIKDAVNFAFRILHFEFRLSSCLTSTSHDAELEYHTRLLNAERSTSKSAAQFPARRTSRSPLRAARCPLPTAS